MTITFKCMPYGSLPYDNIDLATRMMVKIFEENPFLPQLPNINATDNLYTRSG